MHVQQFECYFKVTVEVLEVKNEDDRSLEFW